MICPKYVSQRAKFAENLNNNNKFASQSKFKCLLSNNDATICKDIAEFVTLCLVHPSCKSIMKSGLVGGIQKTTC